ncbi:WecB/TagA/CpsF family glycosyltransferase [Telmatobacter bradus]|uniref:WecB/TagA/CpsF family glycosyltransferase n=1 Tax=Telmatobacter bradus TaxID=474953 RepID=UPI003B428557
MNSNPKYPIALLGLPLSSVTAEEATNRIEQLILSGGSHQVCPVNLDVWLNALDDPHLHRIMAGCSLVVADGMPLVWASGLQGSPLPERVTGVDLVPRLAVLSARKGYRIFLLGGNSGVAERAKKLLERTYPGVQVVGTFCPAKENLIRMDHDEILQRVHEARPDILLVAFGNPKQEKWIWMHRKRLGVPIAMGVGGSFDILVGDTRRAPRWIQRCGMEWAMRCVQEPARLGPRYLRDFIGLTRHLPLALLATWLQPHQPGPSSLQTTATPEVLHVTLDGPLTSELCEPLMKASRECIQTGKVMVVHLQKVRCMTPAGLGVLMEARRTLLDAGLSLSLAGLSMRTRLLLYAWCAQPLFDEWQSSLSSSRPLVEAKHIDLNTKPESAVAQSRMQS